MEASWGDEILGIQQLPQSLMINTKREINFLRLGQPKGQELNDATKVKNACSSKIFDID